MCKVDFFDTPRYPETAPKQSLRAVRMWLPDESESKTAAGKSRKYRSSTIHATKKPRV